MVQHTSHSVTVSGAFIVHSCPRQLTAHVEWSLANEIGQVVKLHWVPQLMTPGTELMRAETEWIGPVGTAARVASSLFGWQQLRFEITEHQSERSDGGRWMHTPALGTFHSMIDSAGNAVLSENVIRAVIAGASGNQGDLSHQLRSALGEAWDAELEHYRAAEQSDTTIFALPRLTAG